MPADPLRQKFRALQSEKELLEANRLVNLAVQWKLPDGSTLLHAGGVWDKIERRYIKREADKVKIVRLEESQVLPARWAAWWLQERAAGRPRDFFTEFLIGDRGSGKTFFLVCFGETAAVKLVEFQPKPPIIWMVSASFRERDELEREIADNFPFEGIWYSHRRAPEYRYTFVNGAVLRNLSADDPETLKQGRVDVLLINEAAKMQKDAYLNGVGRLKDQDGICVATSNPPRNNRGRWVFNLWKKADEAKEAGLKYPIKFLKVMSIGNATLNHETAGQIATVVRDIDPRYARADIDGEMLRVDQPAYYKFQKKTNCRTLPDLGDITREYLRMRTGRAYDYLGGMDFQGRPHMVGVVCKIFGTLDDPQLYFCDEIVCPQATEEDLAEAAKDIGYSPNNILWIGDNSGQWQNGKHLRHQHDSFKAIKDAGFHIEPCIKPKSRDHRPANPPIEHRVTLINRGLERKWLYADEALVPKLVMGLSECELKENRHGRVLPVGYHAHITDACGYPVWWVYSKGRRKLTGAAAESIHIERKSPIG